MNHSSAFCRAQQSFHADRAALATLENVRTVATLAAVAWSREASLAERIEDRRRAAVSTISTLPEAGSLSEELDDLWDSENPDRGVARS